MTCPIDDLLKKARQLPSSPGVYLMKDAKGLLLYVGKANALKDRVSSYFVASTERSPKIELMLTKVRDFEVIPCDNEVEALLKEARLIKDLRPDYNTMLLDGKSYPYLEISNDDYPYVKVTRENHVTGHQYFGPFTHSTSLKSAVNVLQRIFHFRTCEMPIVEGDSKNFSFSPCLLHHIGRCSAPCANKISVSDYAADVAGVKKIVNGKTKEIKKDLQLRMHSYSRALEYEKAAVYRDRIKYIDDLKDMGDLGSQPEIEIAPVNASEGMEELKEALKLSFVPQSIEGFDIAHLQGQQTVASLVCFANGKPNKEGYRRFKIKSDTGGDDFAAMEEVVFRSYSRLKAENQIFPDIVLVDGGKGQLSRAVKVFEGLGVGDQIIISLAKKEEKIYVPHRSNAIKLARHNTALRVLQHVRDEAHRFAQSYHHLLRDKNMYGDQ